MSCAMPDGMYRRITARPVNPDLAMREEWWVEPARQALPVQRVPPELQRRPAQH